MGCNAARPLAEAGSSGCSSCHGFPPAAPHAQIANVQPSDCSTCHGTTAAADGAIVVGGTHMDGFVDIGHVSGFADPSAHGHAAERAISSCTACHGEDYAGAGPAPSCTACHASAGFADWRTNCTFCHGTRTQGYTAADLPKAAPPEGVQGETLAAEPAVGAHRKHVAGGDLSGGVACDECHLVPSSLAHVDGSATISFGSLARQGSSPTEYAGGTCSSVYCHGATLDGGADRTPSWTGSAGCGDCHGTPPLTGQHGLHMTLGDDGTPCHLCHASVAAEALAPGIASTAAAKALHVNGRKDVALHPSLGGTWDPAAKTCSDVICHGPPPTSRSW